MFPLFLCLCDLNNMGKEPALYFGQIEAVADKHINPKFIVLKRKVKNVTSGLRRVLFQLVVEKIQHVFIFDSVSVLKLAEYILFNW